MEAITREEKIMSGENLTPITREEMFLAKAAGQDVKTPEPITRKEMFLSKISGGGGVSTCKLIQVIDGTVTEITADDLNGATMLRYGALYMCKNLKILEIPNTITEFKENAFSPPSERLDFIGEVFEWCKILKSSGNLYDKLHIKGKLLEHIDIIPTSEQLIGNYKVFGIYRYSFYNCKSLKSVKLRSAANRYDIGESVFSNCTNLTRVDIGSEKLHNIGIRNPGLDTHINYELPSNLFSGCTNLTDIYVCWSEGAIKYAPWGATNATIHYDTPIQFCIGEKEYFAQLNMTFKEWCNSEFNTDGFYIDKNDSNYVKNYDGLYVKIINDYGLHVKQNETLKIKYAYKYLLEE